MMKKRLRFLFPLVIFLIMVGFLGKGLYLNPREVPSPLIDKPAPIFELVRLHSPQYTFSSSDMLGQVWLLNVWASWCPSCRTEHPLLLQLARQNIVPIIGLNYKDQPSDAIAWLNNLGDPYRLSVSDIKGRVGMDFGVYGAPETYVIDKQGVIRYKMIGAVYPAILKDEILPLIRELQAA